LPTFQRYDISKRTSHHLKKEEDCDMKAMRYWAVFTLGLAAGAAVALCYAPQTGEKTRRQLRRNWDDASDYVKDISEDVTDQAEKIYKRGRKHVDTVVEQASKVGRKVSDLV
jgi:gas vesicle protein